MSKLIKLTSLAQLKHTKPKILQSKNHELLSRSLKYFTVNDTHTKLGYSYQFGVDKLVFIHEKMSRIGCIADEIDHHPQWTLKEGLLDIGLSTHDIGNKVSVKDYILAKWIEEVLHGKQLQHQLIQLCSSHSYPFQQTQ